MSGRHHDSARSSRHDRNRERISPPRRTATDSRRLFQDTRQRDHIDDRNRNRDYHSSSVRDRTRDYGGHSERDRGRDREADRKRKPDSSSHIHSHSDSKKSRDVLPVPAYSGLASSVVQSIISDRRDNSAMSSSSNTGGYKYLSEGWFNTVKAPEPQIQMPSSSNGRYNHNIKYSHRDDFRNGRMNAPSYGSSGFNQYPGNSGRTDYSNMSAAAGYGQGINMVYPMPGDYGLVQQQQQQQPVIDDSQVQALERRMLEIQRELDTLDNPNEDGSQQPDRHQDRTSRRGGGDRSRGGGDRERHTPKKIADDRSGNRRGNDSGRGRGVGDSRERRRHRSPPVRSLRQHLDPPMRAPPPSLFDIMPPFNALETAKMERERRLIQLREEELERRERELEMKLREVNSRRPLHPPKDQWRYPSPPRIPPMLRRPLVTSKVIKRPRESIHVVRRLPIAPSHRVREESRKRVAERRITTQRERQEPKSKRKNKEPKTITVDDDEAVLEEISDAEDDKPVPEILEAYEASRVQSALMDHNSHYCSLELRSRIKKFNGELEVLAKKIEMSPVKSVRPHASTTTLVTGSEQSKQPAVASTSLVSPSGNIAKVDNEEALETDQVVETEPVVKTEPVKEEPVVETDPAVRTEPLVKTESVVKTEPVVEESVMQNEPAVETEPAGKTASIVESESVVVTEPVMKTEPVVEEAVVETELAVETEPAVDAAPVLKTEPVVQTDPEVNTEPAIETEVMPLEDVKAEELGDVHSPRSLIIDSVLDDIDSDELPSDGPDHTTPLKLEQQEVEAEKHEPILLEKEEKCMSEKGSESIDAKEEPTSDAVHPTVAV